MPSDPQNRTPGSGWSPPIPGSGNPPDHPCVTPHFLSPFLLDDTFQDFSIAPTQLFDINHPLHYHSCGTSSSSLESHHHHLPPTQLFDINTLHYQSPGTFSSPGDHPYIDENICLPTEDKFDEIDWSEIYPSLDSDGALAPIEGERGEMSAAVSNKRNKNWGDDETIKLLNSIATYHQRRDMWVVIHKEEFKDQGRTVGSLKQKFKELRNLKEIRDPATKDSFDRALESYTARQSRTQ